MKQNPVVTLAILILSLLIPFSSVIAQTPVREKELVYHVNAFQGVGYAGVFYPKSEDTVYLLSGQISTITPRYTMVYFWPITQEYRADWSLLDELVDAKLEIRSAEGDLLTLEMSDYVLQDPTGIQSPETYRIFTGDEAHTRFEDYREKLNQYWAALDEYISKESIIAESEKPTAPKMFSTKILQGFLVNLEPGLYQASLFDQEGTIIPGSEKKLIVFEPRRYSIGYKIIPESKWTVPEVTTTPGDVIYLTDGTRLFFQPHTEAEVNNYLYEKLLFPQHPASDNLTWRWIPLLPIEDGVLFYKSAGKEINTAMQGFIVNQIAGGSRGYLIAVYDPVVGDSSPSFYGYEVKTNLQLNQFAYIWLVDRDGKIIEDSIRTLRGIRPPVNWSVLFPAIIPLILASAFWVRRRVR